MYLHLVRFSDQKETSLGMLSLDGQFECYSLEDEKRINKVKGETRIPAGVYEVKFRKVKSPMTMRYRSRFTFFTWHLQLMDVPDFNYVYIHIGNDDDDTDGCILVGDQQVSNRITEDNNLLQSTPAFSRLYRRVVQALNHGESVRIEIVDHSFNMDSL